MMANRAASGLGHCLLCIVFSGSVTAEPLTTGVGEPPAGVSTPDAEAQPRRPGTAETPKSISPGVIDRSVVPTDMPSTSKTVELLLEMQGKNPGLEAGEKPKAEMPTARRSASVASAAKPAFGADATSPFGDAEAIRVKPAAGDPQAVDWSAPPSSGFGGGTTARDPYRLGPSAERPSSSDDVVRLIPRWLVRFVRENRDMVVLGSVVLLVLLWAAAAIGSARRK